MHIKGSVVVENHLVWWLLIHYATSCYQKPEVNILWWLAPMCKSLWPSASLGGTPSKCISCQSKGLLMKCHTSPVDRSSVLRCCVKNWVENLNCQYYRKTAGYYVFIGILVIQSLVLTQWRTISRYTTLSTSLWAKTRNERLYFDSWTRGSALSSQSKSPLGSGPIWIDAYSS